MTKSAVSRKRISSDSAGSYHDIAFKRIAFDGAKLDLNRSMEGIDGAHGVGNSTAQFDASSFRTPLRPAVRLLSLGLSGYSVPMSNGLLSTLPDGG